MSTKHETVEEYQVRQERVQLLQLQNARYKGDDRLVGVVVSTRYLTPKVWTGIHACYVPVDADESDPANRRWVALGLYVAGVGELGRIAEDALKVRYVESEPGPGTVGLGLLIREDGGFVVDLDREPILPLEWKELGKHPDGCISEFYVT